jgi:hypothetical protein
VSKLYYYQNIVKIDHVGKGNKDHAERLIEKTRELMLMVKKTNAVMIAYHDISGLTSADDDYIRLWAAVGKELQEGSVYHVLVPNAWIRVAAKTAAFLGGFKLTFFKSEADAFAYFKEKSIPVDASTKWIQLHTIATV